MTKIEKILNIDFYNKVAELLKSARKSVVQTVNKTMVYTYYEIGRMIVEQEQKGKERAQYGKKILKGLAERLNAEFGKGFSVDNLENMRRFYLAYVISESSLGIGSSKKSETVSRISKNKEFQLSWSHYLKLMRIDDEKERRFYEIEAYKNNWSLKELQRQYDTALYTRLALSRDKDKVLELSAKGLIIEKPKDTIKNSYLRTKIMNKLASYISRKM
jgi:uncharacterized protein YbgA (DUF1722 family)